MLHLKFSESFASFSDPTPGTSPRHTRLSQRGSSRHKPGAHRAGGRAGRAWAVASPGKEKRLIEKMQMLRPSGLRTPGGVCVESSEFTSLKGQPICFQAPGATSGPSEQPSSQPGKSQVLSNAIKLNVNNSAARTAGVPGPPDVAKILSPPGSLPAKFEDPRRVPQQRKWTCLQRTNVPCSQPALPGVSGPSGAGGRGRAGFPDSRGRPSCGILGEGPQAVPLHCPLPTLCAVRVDPPGLGDTVGRPRPGYWADSKTHYNAQPPWAVFPAAVWEWGMTEAAIPGFAISHVDGCQLPSPRDREVRSPDEHRLGTQDAQGEIRCPTEKSHAPRLGLIPRPQKGPLPLPVSPSDGWALTHLGVTPQGLCTCYTIGPVCPGPLQSRSQGAEPTSCSRGCPL